MSRDGSAHSVLPYGSWPTPVTSAVVVQAAVGLSDVGVDGTGVIWSESRPDEGGRIQLVRRDADGATHDLLPDGVNARTAVHEYGGGAWWARDGIVWFTAWADQRLYRLDPSSGVPQPLTPEPAIARGHRHADGEVSPDGEWIVCVRERHAAGGCPADVVNELVRLRANNPSEPTVLVSGPDFVVSPRLDAAAERLCWVEWDHPHMQWDSSRLMVRDLRSGQVSLVAGGAGDYISEPCWQPDGSLTFIADGTGWSNLYRWTADGGVVPLVVLDAEIGMPQWVMGLARYALLADGRIVFAVQREGIDGLAVALPGGAIIDLELPFSFVWCLRAAGGSSVVVVAGGPLAERHIAQVTLGEGGAVRSSETLRAPRDLHALGVAADMVSVAQRVRFPTDGGGDAFGLFYRPVNPGCVAPDGELPPLVVMIHGGPTASALPELQLRIQYWTSRGFAVIDVNYRGSSGYGRDYQHLLDGALGVADVADCLTAARWLVRDERVDGARVCIRGGSSGGFVTLAALAREDTPFAAGADVCGIADLEALALHTHKFESHYLDTLVGPYPQARAIYRERSPIDHVDAFSRPLIVLQGLEDEIVPPAQSELIVDALRRKGVPVAYLAFEGEQHGFRRAENIRRALDAELSFYAQILGFELPASEAIEPVEIENLPGTG